MDRLTHSKNVTFVALATLLMVLAVATPSHHFDGHRFDHGIHGRVWLGPVFPYWGYYPYYGYEPAPNYWYYCPSYGAYYPNVTSCPTEWVPVPAS